MYAPAAEATRERLPFHASFKQNTRSACLRGRKFMAASVTRIFRAGGKPVTMRVLTGLALITRTRSMSVRPLRQLSASFGHCGTGLPLAAVPVWRCCGVFCGIAWHLLGQGQTKTNLAPNKKTAREAPRHHQREKLKTPAMRRRRWFTVPVRRSHLPWWRLCRRA